MSNHKPKTIGIDARFYGEAGPGRYAKAIVQHLEKVDVTNNYIVFLRKKGFTAYTPQKPNFKKVLADYKWYSFAEQILFLLLLLRYRLNLLYVPHFNIPVLYPGKIVTAIPDIIMHEFSTAKTTTRCHLIYSIKKLAYYFAVFAAVLKSKKIIVPSLATKKDFQKHYKFIPESKYVLAYEGVDPDFVGLTEITSDHIIAKYHIKKPFLLYVGSMYRHKNIYALLDMFELLQEKYKFSGSLVITGKHDYFAQQVRAEVLKRKLHADIIMPGMLGYVSDEDIAALRREAALYVFPSLKEGFSLTPLEAQAAGLPVVVSDILCHKEIYGDSVLYFDPQNSADFAEKVHKVLQDPSLRESLVKKGYEQVKKYNWQTTAEITFGVFEKILH